MATLIFGLILFLGIHSISIVAQPLRDRCAAKSEIGWKAFYGLVSFAGLYLIVTGYAQARLTPTLIYATPYGLRHLSSLLMLPFFILFLAPYFKGKISDYSKHPQLIAVILWTVSHLLVNGSLADLLLFGCFFIWAVADLISMRHRVARPLPGLKKSPVNDLIIVVAGLGIYALFVVTLHKMLIGIAIFN
ncbi:NnrU family protein [Psychromonas sp.]|uniref:NnrU family protein n=1 Tax=Psychromonas sp. TaxID=1884585 RepID=UPI0035627372